MGNIIDMASFEHLRRSNSDDRYTCPKTNVTFPHIYKVLVPDGDWVDETAIFNGAFRTEYKLREPSNLEGVPGFPAPSVTQISTLSADDDIHLEVIHLTNMDKALGFKQACALLGVEVEHVCLHKFEQDIFILLCRNDSPKKKGHILYRSTKFQYVEALGCEIESDFVAAFDHKGNIVSLEEIEEFPE